MDHRDIITDALRGIGVVAKDEVADGSDYNIAKGTYYDGVVVQRSDGVMNFSNPNIQFRQGT